MTTATAGSAPGPPTWRGLPAGQPPWPDHGRLDAVTSELAALPPLVFAGECELLRERLAAVTRGEAFVLQGGDCAETFEGATAAAIRAKLQTLLQMALVLTYGASVPVIKIARLAGQFAKPRSRPAERREGIELPAYRGDAVNGFEFTPEARTPDPCRAFTAGGSAALNQAHGWNQDFVRRSPSGQHYERLADEIDHALAFMRACGANPAELRSVELYTSHEALLLDYEQALTRTDPDSGRRYDASAHFLWIGERTRAADGAHVDFARGIRNPIGVKLGPSATEEEVLALAAALNPAGEPGRLTFISRMGAARVRDLLPPLIQAVSRAGTPVAWVCDPMHGNTFEAPSGHKTRRFDDVLAEVHGFFDVHRMLGTHPGGIHIEFTGDNVTECVGGSHQIAEDDLHQRYETACDPRLNRSQSLDLAFTVAESYRTSPRGGGAPRPAQPQSLASVPRRKS
jgi:3-deoxy-7-phosphoheptulonate synthase